MAWTTETIAEPIAELVGVRPKLVRAAAVVMTLLGLLALGQGILTMIGGVLFTLFTRAMGGSVNSELLMLMGVGVILIGLGGLELFAARKVLAGDRWGRRVGLGCAVVLAVLGIIDLSQAPAAGSPTEVWALVVGANVFVLLALVRTSGWFDARHAHSPAAPRVSTVRRLTPVFAVALGFIAVVAFLAISLRIGGDDRPLRYLQSLPEYGLAHPGATLTSTHDRAEDAWFDGASAASTQHSYVAPASEDAVTAWYAAELAARGWESQDLITTGGDGRQVTSQWRKDNARLQLSYSPPDAAGTSRFTVALLAISVRVDPRPLGPLQALPEANLAYPGSTLRPGRADVGRFTTDASVRPAHVSRQYETSASVDAVVRYFESELAEQGWVARPPRPNDRSWATDRAVLTFRVRRTDPPDPVTRYSFDIEEVLGPDATPGVPWR